MSKYKFGQYMCWKGESFDKPHDGEWDGKPVCGCGTHTIDNEEDEPYEVCTECGKPIDRIYEERDDDGSMVCVDCAEKLGLYED